MGRGSLSKKKEEVYEVEKLVDTRGKGKNRMYLVKWENYPGEQNTWEPASHVEGIPEVLNSC